MKTCSKCGSSKPLSEFYEKSARCKECVKAAAIAYRKARPDKYLYANLSQERKEYLTAAKRAARESGAFWVAKRKKYAAHVMAWAAHKAGINRAKKKSAQDDGRHYAHVAAWAKACPADEFRHKYRTDPEFNAKQKLRARLRKLKDGDSDIARLIAYNAKRGKWAHRWSNVLGYGLDELVSHLKRTVPKQHTFDQFLSGELHIDHIVPRSKFDLSSADEVRACWRLSNLRLLPARDNLRKRDKMETLL